MSLMYKLLEAGYPRSEVFHHQSDLYIYKTELTKGVICQWEWEEDTAASLKNQFRDLITGRDMYEIPFQYIPPLVIALVGPSGSGKSTIIQKVCDWGVCTQLRSLTTRQKRQGVSDTDYIFATQAEFQEQIRSDGLVEWTTYGGNLYGTPKSELERVASMRRTCGIAAYDWAGAEALKNQLGAVRCLTVFVNRDKNELCASINARHIPEADKQQRISLLDAEYELSKKCDIVLENKDNIDNVAAQLLRYV